MLLGFVSLGELIDGFGFNTALWCLAGAVATGAVLFAATARARPTVPEKA